MIISSEPTAPSRLRSDQGRRDILCPVAGLLLKPTHSSSAANGSGPYGSGPSLWRTVIMTVRRPCEPLWSRLVALRVDRRKDWCRSFNDDAAPLRRAEVGVSRPCLACRRNLLTGPTAVAQPQRRELD